jgi:P-type Cu+ transporter
MEDNHKDEPFKAAEATKTVKDPVCGMRVNIGSDTRHAEFQGQTFHFCSQKCQTKFKADPSIYISGHAVAPKKPAAANTQYTCPMHPEIIRDAPGACPICGMALEPVVSAGRNLPIPAG